MIDFKKSKKLFIDFDGVIVDSNKFKELAIKKSIFLLFGETKKNKDAIDYFNINAGISREKKLSLFFNENQYSKILKYYNDYCKNFFKKAKPTFGLIKFLKKIKFSSDNLKIYVLSGGEKDEIEYFLIKNNLLFYFDEILASSKSKIEHMEEKQASKNDIFIGDSINDLKASLKIGLKFILIEEYRSLASFPKEDLIKKVVYLKTQNFESLITECIL